YVVSLYAFFFFFSSRRRHTRFSRDWSSDVCSSDLIVPFLACGDVGADRDVLVRLAAHVEERDDRRVDPVVVTLLRAVADLAVPEIGRASCRERGKSPVVAGG